MANEDELEKTREEIRKAKHELAVYKNQLNRLQNRQNYLEKGERAKRTHHLCNLGGAVESLIPVSKQLSKTEFYSLLEKIVDVPEVSRLIEETDRSKNSNTSAEEE